MSRDANPPRSGPSDGRDCHEMLKIPTDYIAGYEKARRIDPEKAAKYVEHTTIGDPEADPVVDLLFSMRAAERSRVVQGCMDQDRQIMREAPELVRDFFEKLDTLPDWFDYAATEPGIRGFHANSELVLQAFVGGVLVEGFATNISRSFVITGRLREQGVRRLKQNNRHVIEIFLPDGLQRYADGWKLSVRIRLVHAQVRRLLRMSPDWDTESWGEPLSAAHIGYAASSFSARLLKHSESMGATFTKEQRESFMLIWKYSAYLLGVPDALLWRDEKDALRTYDIGSICEPPIDFETIIMANSLVNAVPRVVGIEGDKEREELTKLVYVVSRALIGGRMADQLRFPRSRIVGVLPWMRMQSRINRFMRRFRPEAYRARLATNFSHIIAASEYDEAGITYDMPDHAYAERSHSW